ncbi:MAG: hypothetical protein M0P91_11865 [Sulfuricurvum sp.]|jgi:hypothetical protein|uniref:hypothetical protein n=1 Tax=Sulfuricurvum sp. TaxID=2025608 RepID=UPI0025FE6941|nr:hypothetical protein [Sulfuricurvum sp.]MCK9373884.1 hypothetical protein [Sulfuricurvum sp.]
MKTLFTITFIALATLYAAFPSAPITPSTDGTVTVIQANGDKELAWVDEQIQAILPARIGISDAMVGSLGDPIKLKKPVRIGSVPPIGTPVLFAPPKLAGVPKIALPKIVEEPLRLQALINKSALINGKWYKLNDSIRTYTLSEIRFNSVLLTGKADQKLILFLSKQNTNIKITTK